MTKISHDLVKHMSKLARIPISKQEEEELAKIPFDLYREGYIYYGNTHKHPNSTFRYTMSSLLDLMAFDASTNS